MFPPYLFAYAETLGTEPALIALRKCADAAGARLWLTGGSLRDALLTRWPKDVDLAVEGDPIALGKAVADATAGTDHAVSFVLLDDATRTVRLVTKSRQQIDWIDMAALRADTIEGDLCLRDFTVNAIALRWDATFDDASGAFIDPTGGRDHLHQGRLCPTGPTALTDDPLRILRAYRIAAKLGFSLDDTTRQALARHAELVRQPAGERIREELEQLFTTPDPASALRQMQEDGMIRELFPRLEAGVGMSQNDYHHLDVWQHTVQVVAELTTLLGDFEGWPGGVAPGWLNSAPHHRTALFWAALLHDLGKPACRGEQDGRIHFRGHETVGAEQFAEIVQQLRLPRRVSTLVERLIRCHLRPMLLCGEAQKKAISTRATDRLYAAMDGDIRPLFLLALADLRASGGVARGDDDEARLLALYEQLCATHERHIAPVDGQPPLLTGADLMNHCGVPQGPQVGTLLKALREVCIEGQIDTRQQAIEWVRGQLLPPS